MAATATVRDGGIFLRVPHRLRYMVEWIPARRRIKKLDAWRYPATPAVAKRMWRAFQPYGLDVDERFVDLLKLARYIRKCRKIQDSTRLKAIPIVKTEPWIQQLRAYHYAKRVPYCMLAMDMGTGKTKVILDLIANLGLERTLVICPLKAMDVWGVQLYKHGSIKDMLMMALGSESVKKRTEQADIALHTATHLYSHRILLINYESVWRDPFDDWACKQDWDLIVLDESHRSKAAGSNVSKFLYRLSPRGKRRICLTGTPMPNSPLDVYGQYRFLDVGIFGSNYQEFQEEFAVMGGFENRQVFGYKNQQRMMKRFYSIAYQVDSDDVQDFPPETDTTRSDVLDRKTYKIYHELEEEFTAQVNDGEVTVDNALTKILRLQEFTSGYAKLDDKSIQPLHSIKQDLLYDTLQDIARVPIVIFCKFKYDIAACHEVVNNRGWTSAELSGGCNQLAEWQHGEFDVLVSQIQAGKESVDMTRARYGVFYSLVHSLGDYRQCRKRIRRPGQDFPHTFVHLLIKGTIDTKIMWALEHKKNVVESILQQVSR